MFRTLVNTSRRQAVTQPSQWLRAAATFSTTTPTQKPGILPTMGDLPVDVKTRFTEKVNEYHARTDEQHRRKEESEKAAAETLAADSAIQSTDASDTSRSAAASSGMMSRLLHGSAEAQEDTRRIQQSYSNVLARGKYVHEIVFHRVKPGKVEDYIKLIGKEYPRIASDESGHVKLVGSWVTEVGELDTFVHIWEYDNYDGYHNTLRHFADQDSHQKYQSALRSLIFTRQNSLMQEFSFWPTTPPRALGGIFELRSYILHPGKLLEWEQHWRTGLAARRSQGMEAVCAYFSQVGGLNEVHYMWQFPDLKGRQDMRNKSWNAEGWADTVHRTLPLIANMSSRIMVPLPWSPVSTEKVVAGSLLHHYQKIKA